MSADKKSPGPGASGRAGAQSETDGEPGCQTLEEVNRMFRNFWDPTTYWQCEAQGQPARLLRCPNTQLFLDERGQCVHYTDWHWTEPTQPPSRPQKSNGKSSNKS